MEITQAEGKQGFIIYNTLEFLIKNRACPNRKEALEAVLSARDYQELNNLGYRAAEDREVRAVLLSALDHEVRAVREKALETLIKGKAIPASLSEKLRSILQDGEASVLATPLEATIEEVLPLLTEMLELGVHPGFALRMIGSYGTNAAPATEAVHQIIDNTDDKSLADIANDTLERIEGTRAP